MGYEILATYLLTILPHAGLYNYNGRQIRKTFSYEIVCGWINRAYNNSGFQVK